MSNEVKHFPAPTPADREGFLVLVYFGRDGDFLDLCMRRAYLDFCRTLKRVSQLPNYKGKDGVYATAAATVKQEILKLRDEARVTIQTDFDDWHRRVCDRLRGTYAKGDYPDFHYGQAQKWLNMTIKYIYVLGENRLDGYSGYTRIFPLAHAPLDSKMMDILRRRGLPDNLLPQSEWSQIDDYDEYLAVQDWIRRRFSDSVPLAVEFHLWQEGNAWSQSAVRTSRQP
jgi:hypothetical protein